MRASNLKSNYEKNWREMATPSLISAPSYLKKKMIILILQKRLDALFPMGTVKEEFLSAAAVSVQVSPPIRFEVYAPVYAMISIPRPKA